MYLFPVNTPSLDQGSRGKFYKSSMQNCLQKVNKTYVNHPISHNLGWVSEGSLYWGNGPFDITDFDITDSDITNLI